MKITKFGHSCLLVEEGGARILIDPGVWSTLPELTGIDAILVTHEHGDHTDPTKLKKLLADNPGAQIYTNAGVGMKLEAEGIPFKTLLHKEKTEIKGVSIEGVGEKHALVYRTLPIVDNTGYLIAGRLFQPGDALTIPDQPVEILACPVAAPWMNLTNMLDYGLAVKPKTIIPIHDGFLTPSNPYYPHADREFKKAGIGWVMLENGKNVEF